MGAQSAGRKEEGLGAPWLFPVVLAVWLLHCMEALATEMESLGQNCLFVFKHRF